MFHSLLTLLLLLCDSQECLSSLVFSIDQTTKLSLACRTHICLLHLLTLSFPSLGSVTTHKTPFFLLCLTKRKGIAVTLQEELTVFMEQSCLGEVHVCFGFVVWSMSGHGNL